MSIRASVKVGMTRRGGGAPAAPVSPYAPSVPLYASDFTAPADQTLLRTITPWVATNRDALVVADRDTLVIGQPEQATAMNDNGQSDFFSAGVGVYIYRIETGSARHAIEVEQVIGLTRKIAFASVHNGLRADLFNHPDGDGAGDWTGASGSEVRTNVGAFSNQPPYPFVTARFMHWRGFATNAPLRINVFDSRAYVTLGGMPYADFPITSTGTGVGLTTAGSSGSQVRRVIVAVRKTHFTVNSGKGWYNRIKGWAVLANGGRSITRTGTWRGEEPTGLYWSLKRPTDGTVQKIWAGVPTAGTVITVTSGAGGNKVGTWSATVDIEWKIDGTNPYCFGIAAKDTVGINVPGTNTDFDNAYEQGAFYVCAGFIAAGQSEIAGANGFVAGPGFTDFAGACWYQQPDAGSIEQTYNYATAWERDQTDYNGLLDRQTAWFCKTMTQAMGGPVSLSYVAKGARTSANLTPGGAEWASIQSHLGFVGCFEHMILGQGSAEVNSSGVETWQGNWATGIPAYLAYANQPAGHVPYTFLVPTGFGSNGTAIGTSQQIAQANEMRAIQLGFPAYMASLPTPYNVVRACTFTDLFVDASGEFTDAIRGGGEGLRRVAITMAKTLSYTGNGWGSFDGRGPLVTAISRSGAAITITYDLNGAASLSGAALTEHKVSTDLAMTSLLTVNSAAVSGSTVVVTLSANPGAPVYWADYRDMNPSQNGRAIGNYPAQSDGALTIPAMFTAVPLLTN